MKKIRLDKEIYAQEGRPCHVTICASEGLSPFSNDKFTVHAMGLLESLCSKYKIFIYVYCFMPDHVHIILSVRGEKSIVGIVQAFKSKVTIESRKYGFLGRIFQPRFYDRFIRNFEALEREIRYVLNNPVRKGLAAEPDQYPYSRCFL